MEPEWANFLENDAFLLQQWPGEPGRPSLDLSSEHPLSVSIPAVARPDPKPYNLTPYQRQYTDALVQDMPVGHLDKSTGRNMISRPAIEPTENEEARTGNPTATDTLLKRTKNDADSLTACWKSPICPNHTPNQKVPPNPSSCGAGCAPFLFAGPQKSLAMALDDAMVSRKEIRIDEETLEMPFELSPSAQTYKQSESDADDREQRRVSKILTQSKRQNQEDPGNHSDDTLADASCETAESETGQPRRRLPHSQVERKYRETLNSQLEALRKCVPSLKPSHDQTSGTKVLRPGDIEDLTTPGKPSKALVLSSATAYIRQIEKESKQLQEDNKTLQATVVMLQALVHCEDCTVMQYVMNLNREGK